MNVIRGTIRPSCCGKPAKVRSYTFEPWPGGLSTAEFYHCKRCGRNGIPFEYDAVTKSERNEAAKRYETERERVYAEGVADDERLSANV